MKKIYIMVLLIFSIIITGCNNEGYLDGKSLVMSDRPVISDEINDYRNYTSVLNFIFDNNEVTVDPYDIKGEYTYDEDTLEILLEDDDDSLKIVFENISKSDQDFIDFTGVVTDVKMEKDTEKLTPLITIHEKIRLGETFAFIEEE